MKTIPAINEETLTVYLNKPELIKQTIVQIEKDFDLYVLEIVLDDSNKNVYKQLTEWMNPIIKKLLQTNYQKLLQLLYRIDMNENTISRVIKETKATQLSAELTRLIIMRELQKVVIKNYYKS